MLASIGSASVLGVTGTAVQVQVHVSQGLPGLTVVGLPDAACREARDRVRAALLSSKLAFPTTRVTVNLAPSGVRKSGAGLDLPIAVGLLVASGQLPTEAVEGMTFIGELGLDGSVRPVVGVIPMLSVVSSGSVVVSAASLGEAMVAVGDAKGVHFLRELVDALRGDARWPTVVPPARATRSPDSADLRDVRGQGWARRVLEVAAAGGHHMLMVGPPGGGKTMLAERLPGLLADLDGKTSMEVTAVESAVGLRAGRSGLVTRPPFRHPHHTASAVSLIGGGSHHLRPGEVSLAHGGVLFLDELGEFPRTVLDALRQPLEEGSVRIARAHASAVMPARFQLVAAMNPCPCGHSGFGGCRCSSAAADRYARRVSGPLLDRFDLRIPVEPPQASELFDTSPGEMSAVVAERVAVARARAVERGARCNNSLTPSMLDETSRLTPAATSLLAGAVTAGRLSARGVRRVRAVALTIDDLAGGVGTLSEDCVAEACAMRADVTPLLQVSP